MDIIVFKPFRDGYIFYTILYILSKNITILQYIFKKYPLVSLLEKAMVAFFRGRMRVSDGGSSGRGGQGNARIRLCERRNQIPAFKGQARQGGCPLAGAPSRWVMRT
jgi:hypothetical protein